MQGITTRLSYDDGMKGFLNQSNENFSLEAPNLGLGRINLELEEITPTPPPSPTTAPAPAPTPPGECLGIEGVAVEDVTQDTPPDIPVASNVVPHVQDESTETESLNDSDCDYEVGIL